MLEDELNSYLLNGGSNYSCMDVRICVSSSMLYPIFVSYDVIHFPREAVPLFPSHSPCKCSMAMSTLQINLKNS